MLAPLRIELDAGRYALAVQVLHEARRSWHQLDAALVKARANQPHIDATSQVNRPGSLQEAPTCERL